MTRRIERAMALLRRGDVSVTDACAAVGCTSLGSFSARFTELVGESPSAYRARDHEALDSFASCQAMMLTRHRRGEGRAHLDERRVKVEGERADDATVAVGGATAS
jgi:AraC-like DNA-binding protein